MIGRKRRTDPQSESEGGKIQALVREEYKLRAPEQCQHRVRTCVQAILGNRVENPKESRESLREKAVKWRCGI